MSKPKINKDDWERITQRLAGQTADVFKPKEIQVIQDFIVTALGDWDKAFPAE